MTHSSANDRRATEAVCPSDAESAAPHAWRMPEELPQIYRLLVENVRDYAIFALDTTGHILSWNPGAERFKGYTAEDIVGRTRLFHRKGTKSAKGSTDRGY